MSFKITNNLQSGSNLAKVVYANQQPSFTTDLDNEVAYYKDGVLTSSEGLTYDGQNLRSNAGGVFATTTVVAESADTPGSFARIVSGDNNGYIDFGSAGDQVDCRMISFNPNPAIPGLRNLSLINETGGNIQTLAATQIGSPFAPGFKLDYGRVPAPGGTNQDAIITFQTGIFTTTPPKVIVTLFDSDGPNVNSGVNITPYVYDTTITGCKVRGLGANQIATSIFYDYIALGV